MRVLSGVLVASALAMPAAAGAQGVSTQVRVGPRTIGIHTNVLLRFRQPVTTGHIADERSIEALQISGPSRAACIGSGRVVLPAARVGTIMRRTLRPSSLGGRWCTGTYRGRVTYQVEPACSQSGPVRAKLVACPMFIMAPRTLATFRFRVTAR